MRFLLPCCLCLAAAGCAEEPWGVTASEHAPAARATASFEGADYAEAASAPADASGEISGEAAPLPEAIGATAGVPAAAVRPKIIYTAEVSLVVDDFAATEQAFLEMVASQGGYVADSSAQRSEGVARSGRWVVRVPTGEYDTFLAGLDRLGFISDRRQTAADVTAEFIDIQARVTNLKRLEERLIDLLANRNGKLEELLTIEQELARVRGEVEQAEGRLRFLTNKTSFSTITVNVREQQDYVPPQPPPPDPTFGTRIAATWGSSVKSLRQAAEAAVLYAVAAAPWLGVLALPALCGLLVVLSRRRRAASS